MASRLERLSEPLICLLPNLRDTSLPKRGGSLWGQPFQKGYLRKGYLYKGSSSGSVLLVALWSLCLLTVFAIHLGYRVRQKIVLIERLNSRGSLHFIAEAGVKQAIAELKKKEPSGYDALNQAWSNNPNIFKDVSIGLGKFTVGYNYIEYRSGCQQTRYGLVDEERKLNLNKAGLNQILRLIMIVTGFDKTEAESLAAAIVDWRDGDSHLSIPLGSAEDRYYCNLGNPYEAKDAEFEVFDELLLVRGMGQEILDKLKDYITIYSNGNININTAVPQVLFALNLGDDLVDKILSFRYGEDEIEATSDDNIFTSPSAIVGELSQFAVLSPSEIVGLSNLVSAGSISTSSSNFRIRAVAQLGKRESQVICIVNQEGKILSWKEG